MTLLALDSRWRRFNDETRACPCCGQTFGGIFDLGYDHPDAWPHGPRDGGETVTLGSDRLGAHLCSFSGRYFLRCVLALPIKGAGDSFSFGPWAEVSLDTFETYLKSAEGPAFAQTEGLLANALPLFEADAQTPITLAVTTADRCPEIKPHPGGALADAQTNGISFDDLLDIYAASGQDIRPHLTRD